MSTRHGLTPVMDEAARALQERRMGARAEELRQQDLLDPVTPEEMAEAKRDLGAGAGRLAVLAKARARKAGRKPGSKNRRNDDLVAYLSQFGTDPLVGAMILQSTPTEVLMEQSGKSYLECLDRQIRCRELLAPYFHSKKPVAAVIGFAGVGDLIIEGVTHSRDEIDALMASQTIDLLPEPPLPFGRAPEDERDPVDDDIGESEAA